MLIKDGKMLIMVSEDPIIQEKMKAIDPGGIAEIKDFPIDPVKPLEPVKNKNSYAKKIAVDYGKLYDPDDMFPIMQEYKRVKALPMSDERTVRLNVIGTLIKRFIVYVDENIEGSASKLNMLDDNIHCVIFNDIKSDLAHQGVNTVSALTESTDTEVLDAIWDNFSKKIKKRFGIS